MAVASKPNIDATANISATPGAPWSAADGEKLSVRPRPSGPPPLKRVTRAKTIRMLNSARTKTARIFAPISMPGGAEHLDDHHGDQGPDPPRHVGTGVVLDKAAHGAPYRPYMAACTAQ